MVFNNNVLQYIAVARMSGQRGRGLLCCLLEPSFARQFCSPVLTFQPFLCLSLVLCCSLGSYITGTTLDVEGGEEVLSATSQRQEDGRM
jgi:hypothetical protein